LEGSIAAGIVGVINGADILRVHDVGPTVRAVRIANALMKTSCKND
jgi:dihydropteroate synthase